MMKPFHGNQRDDNDDEQDELFYTVESIIASRRFGRKVNHRVRWEGYEGYSCRDAGHGG